MVEALHRDFLDLHSEPADDEVIERWIEGQTGWPFVDACMRALKQPAGSIFGCAPCWWHSVRIICGSRGRHLPIAWPAFCRLRAGYSLQPVPNAVRHYGYQR